MKEWVTHLFLERRPSGLFSVYINPLCCRLFIFACGLKDSISRVVRNTIKYKKFDGRQHQGLLNRWKNIYSVATVHKLCHVLYLPGVLQKYLKVTVKTKYKKNLPQVVCLFPRGLPLSKSWFSGYCPRGPIHEIFRLLPAGGLSDKRTQTEQ
jgi:hypothetical protein